MSARVFWVVLGCLVCQLGLGYGYVFGPLAKDILAEFGWTRAMYSGARAPQLFVIAAMSPLIGFLTVRFGARVVLVVATFLLALSFSLIASMQSLWHLYALVVLQGLSVAGLGDITVGQAVSQWVDRGRGLALGIVYTGSNIGGFFLTRLGAAIADAGSWRTAFLVMGIGALFVILPFALFAVRAPPGAAAPTPAAPRDADLGEAGDLSARQAYRTRTFWILFASLFTFFFYFLGMLEHLVLFLTDKGMERGEATAYFSNAIAMGMVSKIAFGFLADRMNHKSALLLDYGLLALSSVILLALPNDVFIWGFVLTYGFATAARDVIYPLIVTSCFGVRYMAEIYGGLMLALAPGGALGPLFAAAIHDIFKSYELAFVTFATLNVLAVVALFFVRDERGRAT